MFYEAVSMTKLKIEIKIVQCFEPNTRLYCNCDKYKLFNVKIEVVL